MYFTGLKSRADVNKAKAWALDHGLTHVTNCYPSGFTDKGNYKKDENAFGQFLKDFSLAYAERTEDIAYLMLDPDKNPTSNSIFYAVQFEAMKKGGLIDKIVQIPFTNRNDVTDPAKDTKHTRKYWERATNAAATDADSYAKGQCGVHITHYQIPKGDNKYYIEAHIRDAHGIEIGHVDRTDATEPVNVYGVYLWCW